jgi:hypothetical protein
MLDRDRVAMDEIKSKEKTVNADTSQPVSPPAPTVGMRTIYKYQIGRPGVIADVEMPRDASVLDAQWQNGTFVVWAAVVSDQPKVSRRFAVFGTGHNLGDDAMRHISTQQVGDFVWHVFELAFSRPSPLPSEVTR